jgi:large subunit ribosomal protein L29
MADASDLALLDPEELETRLAETRRELFNLRFQAATGQLDNSSRLGHVRRDVARILTVLREREIAEGEGTFVVPTVAQQETARAHLAVQDEAGAATQQAHEHEHEHEHGHDADHAMSAEGGIDDDVEDAGADADTEVESDQEEES